MHVPSSIFHLGCLQNCRIHPTEDQLHGRLTAESYELPVFIVNTGNLRGSGSFVSLMMSDFEKGEQIQMGDKARRVGSCISCLNFVNS